MTRELRAGNFRAIDCAHCQVPMQTRPGWGTSYVRCPRCRRVYAACYEDEVRAAVRGGRTPQRAAGRHRAGGAGTSGSPRDGEAEFQRYKARLESWFATIDDRNPWKVLGLDTGATEADAKARFRALAIEHHPDRGGDPERMRKYIDAWHAIRGRRRQRPRD